MPALSIAMPVRRRMVFLPAVPPAQTSFWIRSSSFEPSFTPSVATRRTDGWRRFAGTAARSGPRRSRYGDSLAKNGQRIEDLLGVLFAATFDEDPVGKAAEDAERSKTRSRGHDTNSSRTNLAMMLSISTDPPGGPVMMRRVVFRSTGYKRSQRDSPEISPEPSSPRHEAWGAKPTSRLALSLA